jgi:NTE family protein
MPIKSLFRFIVLTVLGFGLMPADSASQPSRPKTGIVLSGGGARGLAHIGVLKVLEEVNMPIDYIGGTSMGSIVGGLYASGYNAQQLEEIAMTTDWVGLFSDESRRRYVPIEEKAENSKYMLSLPMRGLNISLPGGLVSGQEASKMLAGLTWHVHHIQDFNELPIPFVCIATDLETGEAIVIRNGSLAEAMRASMTLPSIFTPARVEGRNALDGGIARNFPVVDVIEMGADILIGVDVSTLMASSDSLFTLIDILNQTVSFQIERTTFAQRQLATVLLQPDMETIGMMSFEYTREIIDAGEAIARAHIDELRQIADSLNAYGLEERILPYVELTGMPIVIRDIRYEGLESTDPRMIDAELQMQLPLNTVITRGDLNLAIDRLYSLQFFESVTYRLEPARSGYSVILKFQELDHDKFRVGLRYDSREKASLLFNNTYRNWLIPSSTLRLTVRLGEMTSVEGQLYSYIGTNPKLGSSLRLKYSKDRFEQYLGRVNQGTLSTDLYQAEFWAGPVLSSMLQSGIGYRFDLFDSKSISGTVRQPSDGFTSTHVPFAFLILDTANDAYFATNGQYISLRADFGSPMDDKKSYDRYEAIWYNYIPFTEYVTINLNFQAGYSTGNLPTHRSFYLGDVETLVGFRRDQMNGTSYRMTQIAMQTELQHNRYLTLLWNAFSADGFWGTPESRIPFIIGWGVSVGANTFVGPVNITLMGNQDEALPILHASVGFRF